MTQVLQMLQTKPCRIYKNVDYAGIWIRFFYRDFPVIIIYLLHKDYKFLSMIIMCNCIKALLGFSLQVSEIFLIAFWQHELPVISEDTFSVIILGNPYKLPANSPKHL